MVKIYFDVIRKVVRKSLGLACFMVPITVAFALIGVFLKYYLYIYLRHGFSELVQRSFQIFWGQCRFFDGLWLSETERS